MKKLRRYSLLCMIICFYSYSIYGMNKFYGLIGVTIPQTAKGVLGNFRLDNGYGIRDYLAQYIAFDKQITLGSARWEGFDAIENAYKQFLNHNSFAAIEGALNNNIIDKDYALNALYFSHTVARQFQEHIEYSQDFARQYSSDPEQYVWVDNNAFNSERYALLKKMKEEQKAIVKLVDFLKQRPINKEYSITSYGSIFKKEETLRRGWSAFEFDTYSNNVIKPCRIGHVHDGPLGTFDPFKEYTIHEYLKKYCEKTEDTIEWRVLKKAYNDFLFYNEPSSIQRSFEISRDVQAGKIKLIWSRSPIVYNVTKKDIKEAMFFTKAVAQAMQQYLGLDYSVCSKLYRDPNQLKDKDVRLFALLGANPAAIAQTRNGILGNFDNKQSYGTNCAVQDYLQKYIARNLQIPEHAVKSEATFLDIKKAFESFVSHNHPDAILRDFENELINKQYAKDALQFTFCVIHAFEKYLADFKDDSYEMELFDLFWQIERMKEKGYEMKFDAKGDGIHNIKE